PGPLLRPFGRPAPPPPGPDGSVAPAQPPAVLPEGEFARLINGDHVVVSADAPAGLPLPQGPGLRTVKADGSRFRVAARERAGGRLVEVGADLAPLEDRVGGLRNRVIVLSLVGAALCGLAAWWLAGLALRPLVALRSAAAKVSTTRDLSTRLPDSGGPEEVDTLSSTVNAMLARLESSARETEEALEATRRFAADAGHELRTPLTALRANAGSLRRNPDMTEHQRRAILAELEAEAERTVRVLGALQTLARGDAAAMVPRERVDLAELADVATEHARRRHPAVTFGLRAPGEAPLEGWPDGLRALVDNLLDNAARHGRVDGRVEVTLEHRDGRLLVTVDDDGAGLAEADRERVFERFARAEGAGEGSGLGLALVRQQAELHGGWAELESSPLGGLRAVVRLGAAGSAGFA
ncbi:MAG: HAMP domain-containing histidine kinase, partial [Actinomycetota bacterium]|nr:HAMP domain-containing histidine kinase [Actinomycetota bacterium]